MQWQCNHELSLFQWIFFRYTLNITNINTNIFLCLNMNGGMLRTYFCQFSQILKSCESPMSASVVSFNQLGNYWIAERLNDWWNCKPLILSPFPTKYVFAFLIFPVENLFFEPSWLIGWKRNSTVSKFSDGATFVIYWRLTNFNLKTHQKPKFSLWQSGWLFACHMWVHAKKWVAVLNFAEIEV